MILILTVTSFALEIIVPLLEDQQTEQLASVSDFGDEDDMDDKDESEQEDLNDDLFFEVVDPLANTLETETKNTAFSIYLFPIVTSHTDTPYSPPEMRM